MNFRGLQYLIALADHRHFGKAAESCCVTQPALSMQLKKLEETLDIQLIERTNKSVILTSHGSVLAERARVILNYVEELKETAKSIRNPLSGELKIGIIPTLAPYYLPHIMPQLHTQFSKLKIFLIEAQTSVLIEQLKNGKLDAALFTLPVSPHTGLVYFPLFSEELLLGVPLSHPFAKRKTIRQSELIDHPLLLLAEGDCLHDQVLDVCGTTYSQDTPYFQATSLEILRHMIASEMGIALFPKMAQKENDGVAYLMFNHPKPSREIGMVWRKSSAKGKTLTHIMEFLKGIL